MLSIQTFFEHNGDTETTKVDTNKVHGHDRAPLSSILYRFHNNATHPIDGQPDFTPGYQHCASNGSGAYSVQHVDGKHGINAEYARGHGKGREPEWFRFTKKLNNKFWDLESGEKVDVSDVPEKYKSSPKK